MHNTDNLTPLLSRSHGTFMSKPTVTSVYVTHPTIVCACIGQNKITIGELLYFWMDETIAVWFHHKGVAETGLDWCYRKVIHPQFQGVAIQGKGRPQPIVRPYGTSLLCTHFTSFYISTLLEYLLHLFLIQFLQFPCAWVSVHKY